MPPQKRYSIEGRRLLLLTGGRLGVFTAKTAVCIMRYSPQHVAAILDEKYAGGRAEEVIGIGAGIPIVASVAEAMRYGPNQLLIGIAPVGGTVEPSWRVHITDALNAGMDIVAGLHIPLGKDEEFARLARGSGARIFDLREPPADIPIGTGKAAKVKAKRVLTVGSDCNIGKMVTSLELARALQKKGIDAAFVATGQTGIMLEGAGIAIDRVICDFLAGAAEMLVLENSEHQILSIEGQGGIVNPAYSGVTLGLIHGSCPDAMILCHQPGRNRDMHFDFPIPSLNDLINLYERIAEPVYRSKVIGVSLNTVAMSEAGAQEAVESTRKETGLPVTDPIRFGVEPLACAVEKLLGEQSA